MSMSDHFHTRSTSASPQLQQSQYFYETPAGAPTANIVSPGWQPVPLNTIDYANSSVNAALTAVPPALTPTYYVTIPSGRWRVSGWCNAINCGGTFQVRLATDSGHYVVVGNTGHSAITTCMTRSQFDSIIYGPLTVRLEYYAQAATGTLGSANQLGSAVETVNAGIMLTYLHA